jgi:hypothetical protein
MNLGNSTSERDVRQRQRDGASSLVDWLDVLGEHQKAGKYKRMKGAVL